MRNDQTDLVLSVQKRFDSVAEPEISNRVFQQIYQASVKDDDIEVARITAKMLLGLAALGEPITDDAKKWCEHFGPMFSDSV